MCDRPVLFQSHLVLLDCTAVTTISAIASVTVATIGTLACVTFILNLLFRCKEN